MVFKDRLLGLIHKQIVTDEHHRPVAVQIPYEQWLEIEKTLGRPSEVEAFDLTGLAGSLTWGEDAVAYQRRVREEWSP